MTGTAPDDVPRRTWPVDPEGTSAQAAAERAAIRAAGDRLLAGAPLRSKTGEPSVVQLAVEADAKRHLLTHKHTDLKDHFAALVKTHGRVPAAFKPLEAKGERLGVDNARLRKRVNELSALVETYALQVGVLTQENARLAAVAEGVHDRAAVPALSDLRARRLREGR